MPAGRRAGDEALRRTAELTPDVITMDIDMPVVDGVEATRLIVQYFKTPVVIVAGFASGGRIDDALAAVVVAHIPKSRAWDELVPALRNVARGAKPRVVPSAQVWRTRFMGQGRAKVSVQLKQDAEMWAWRSFDCTPRRIRGRRTW